MSKDGPCCGNCPYWHRQGRHVNTGIAFGECRRFPPPLVPGGAPADEDAAFGVEDAAFGVFALTAEPILCGEHPGHPARPRARGPLIP